MEAKQARKLYIVQVCEPNPNNHNCGAHRISNGVEVWFSDGHPIKTKDEALEFANLIIKAPDLLSENQKLKTLNAELIEALERIMHMSEDSGREGCTWGDTDYDSFSFVEGYNSCLNEIKSSIKPLIKKAKGVE